MKTLIVYATHNGSTEKAARLIASKLHGCDVKNIAKERFDLSLYDRVLVGSNIRMGTVDRKIRQLLLSEIGTLLQKQLGLFLCCAFYENGELYFRNNVPEQLLRHAKAAETLGGAFDVQNLRGLDKIAGKMVRKADHDRGILRTFSLQIDRIDAFVQKLGDATDS